MTAHAFHYKVNEGERIVQAGKVRSTLRSSIEGGNAIVHIYAHKDEQTH